MTPHFLLDYETQTRSCYAVMDEFGNMVPCNDSTWYYVSPNVQNFLSWN